MKELTSLELLMEYMEQNQYFIGNDLLAKYNELLQKEKKAINYTHCCESDIEQLVCGCGKNKPVRREPAYLHCDWCGSITEETK